MIENNWHKLIKPSKVECVEGINDLSYSKFVIEPLERGFGLTLGNALRRVMLSSLQGVAVSSIKIHGIQQEFSYLKGCIEDVSSIILNLKKLRIKSNTFHPTSVFINVKGPGAVTAADIEVDHNIEILNKDLVICNLSDDIEFKMQLHIGVGKGYISAEVKSDTDKEIGLIYVDSIFSPVLHVNYDVDDSRIGGVIDYDKLTIDIKTDESIPPKEALAVAAKILQDQLSSFVTIDFNDNKPEADVVPNDDLPFNKNLLKKVDELEFSVRSANCLKADDIVYIGDLVQKTESEMLRTPNFGRKSLNEIREILGKMGLFLGMKVEGWPPKDVEELSKKYEDKY